MKAGWILIFIMTIFLTIAAPVLSLAVEPSGEPDGKPRGIPNASAALAETTVTASSGSIETVSCQDLAAVLRENQAATRNDLRQIKRDVAQLQQKLDEPGMGQIFSGIGYIFGLFGVAALVASWKKRER